MLQTTIEMIVSKMSQAYITPPIATDNCQFMTTPPVGVISSRHILHQSIESSDLGY